MIFTGGLKVFRADQGKRDDHKVAVPQKSVLRQYLDRFASAEVAHRRSPSEAIAQQWWGPGGGG